MNNSKPVTVCAAIGALLAAAAAQAGSVNPTMTVVNTSANPVPVTGTIRVSNTVVPVEIRNADPIPVIVQAQAAVLGHWYASFKTPKTPVIFTVPAGKRFVVTDVVVSTRMTDFSTPSFTLLSECGTNDTKAVLGGWPMFDQVRDFDFTAQIHLTTGVALEAGECFKVAVGADNNSAMVTWYEVGAN